MLREVPTFQEDFERSPSLMNNVDLTTGEHQEDHLTNADTLDDVFGSAPASPIQIAPESAVRDGTATSVRRGTGSDEISDVHRLRSTHVTNGYREGIAVSKEKFMQEGFDEGYTLGAELGLKVGWCLGALEGIWHALKPMKQTTSPQSSSQEVESSTTRTEVAKMYFQAEEELAMQKLYDSKHFSENGIWLYDVQSHDHGASELTFDEIAAAHPLVREWSLRVETFAERLGLKMD
nr:uncharacterized protein yae1 [Quercus suber]